MEGNVQNNQAFYNLRGKVVSIPQIDATLEKTGYAADAKVVGDALALRVRKDEIVDHLTSELKYLPLSARQGSVLRSMIDKINLSQAGTVGYDNTTSELEASNMQGALDEVAEMAKKALPSDGSKMLEGVLNLRNADNGYASLHKNNTDTTDYGTKIADRTKDGKNAFLTVRASTDECSFTDSKGNTRHLFHEGIKTFGSYVGSGSASPRTIDTKGIGRMLMVYSDTRLSFVTPKGSLTINIVGGEFEWIAGEKVYYLNGKLMLETTSVAFNASNTTYYYQTI